MVNPFHHPTDTLLAVLAAYLLYVGVRNCMAVLQHIRTTGPRPRLMLVTATCGALSQIAGGSLAIAYSSWVAALGAIALAWILGQLHGLLLLTYIFAAGRAADRHRTRPIAESGHHPPEDEPDHE